jgi:hypothetical protein
VLTREGKKKQNPRESKRCKRSKMLKRERYIKRAKSYIGSEREKRKKSLVEEENKGDERR